MTGDRSEKGFPKPVPVPDKARPDGSVRDQVLRMERYYRFHASIYDPTRWTFLFGRTGLIAQTRTARPQRILEVGCGTGQVLLQLARLHTGALLTGLDVSDAMLRKCRLRMRKIMPAPELVRQSYGLPILRCGAADGSPVQDNGVPMFTDPGSHPAAPHQATIEENRYDLVLFSYALSMLNPGWQEAIRRGVTELKPGGMIAVVDFHATPFAWFSRWMRVNHVRMEGHLLPGLQQHFETVSAEIFRAYGGLWTYFRFTGTKP